MMSILTITGIYLDLFLASDFTQLWTVVTDFMFSPVLFKWAVILRIINFIVNGNFTSHVELLALILSFHSWDSEFSDGRCGKGPNSWDCWRGSTIDSWTPI